MDVGDPSNFARIIDLYGGSHDAIAAEISGETYTDEQISETVQKVYEETGYLLDPHGACGYRALAEELQPGETGVFLIGAEVKIPEKLQEFMRGKKLSVPMSKDFASFKEYLMKQ